MFSVPGIFSLPNELLIQILSLVCNSQTRYHSLLLVNRRIHTLTKFEQLPHIPIRLNASSVESFLEFIGNDDNSSLVKHLWINGTSPTCMKIAGSCTNLVSLACSKVVLYSICRPNPFLSVYDISHKALRELTLFDNTDCWSFLSSIPYGRGKTLCQQITHLRLQEPLSDDFNPGSFTSLTHYSFSGNQITLVKLIRDLAPIQKLPNLKHIVYTTYFWRDAPPDERTRVISSVDERFRVIYFGPQLPGEFALWCGSARQTDSLWTGVGTLKCLL